MTTNKKLEEKLVYATSRVKEAKRTNEFVTELEAWNKAINRYQEAYKITRQEDFTEIEFRIEDHIQVAEQVFRRLSDREEMIDMIENANSLINSGKDLLGHESEAAMKTYIEAGKLYFDAAKIARDQGFREKKDLESTLFQIRSQIQNIEFELIENRFKNGLFFLSKNSFDQAQKAYTAVVESIEDYAIDIPGEFDTFRWRTESIFYQSILDIIENQINTGINGFEKGEYEGSKQLFEELIEITIAVQNDVNEEGMDDALQRAEKITELCRQNNTKAEQVLSDSVNPEEVSLHRPDIDL